MYSLKLCFETRIISILINELSRLCAFAFRRIHIDMPPGCAGKGGIAGLLPATPASRLKRAGGTEQHQARCKTYGGDKKYWYTWYTRHIQRFNRRLGDSSAIIVLSTAGEIRCQMKGVLQWRTHLQSK